MLDAEPCPAEFRGLEPLRLSLRALKEKLEGILSAEGFSSSELVIATLQFSPDPAQHDDHCSVCCATLQTAEGEPVECVVDYLGNKRAQQGAAADALAAASRRQGRG